jgi:hypothetical protein
MVLVLRTRTGKNGGGYHVRLGLALGASEPCYGAEDDDEDDADEETPAVWRRSVMLNSESIVRKYPFAIL